MDAKEHHIATIHQQMVEIKRRMQDALKTGDFRKAEQALDQLNTYRRLLETSSRWGSTEIDLAPSLINSVAMQS